MGGSAAGSAGGLEIAWELHVDELSILFALLAVGVGLLTVIYSLGYMPTELARQGIAGRAPAYYGYLALFTIAMLGVFFASNLIVLYLFWDLADVASFLLIGLNWRDPAARRGAVRALAVTALGGLAVLISFVLLASAAGTWSIPTLLERGDVIRASPLFVPAVLLLVVGAAAKSAQFPLHGWLPSAMVAPTPANAYLDSAALVAAGVYLLARLQPALGDSDVWLWSVAGVGLASALIGGVLALRARGLKIILAYSTISQYGFMFVLLGLASATATFAALLFVVHHALLKAGLFFSVGAIERATGQSEIGQMGGLWRRQRLLLVVTAGLALSMAGVPPLAGFWMKEAFLKATLDAGGTVLLGTALIASALTLAYMLRLVAGAFVWGRPMAELAGSPTPALVGPPLLLLVITVVAGLWPEPVSHYLVEPAAMAIAREEPHVELAYELGTPLLLSLTVLLAGIGVFVADRRWAAPIDALAASLRLVGRGDEGLFAAAQRAGRQTLRVQTGLLSDYALLTIVGLLGLVSLVAWRASIELAPGRGEVAVVPGLEWALALLVALVVGGTILTLLLRRHLHVVLALSAVGYLIAAVFALTMAPDVGLVQVHVETLVTVLFVTMLVRLPTAVRTSPSASTRPRHRPLNVVVALLCGLGSAWISWLAIGHEPAEPLGRWFTANAPELTHGRDLVAAILVEYRAFDTLGEILVFGVAAAGVYVLARMIHEDAGRERT